MDYTNSHHEIPSVVMTNSFHQWAAGKTNCEVFDVSCETDKDCRAACEILFSEDGGEITKFVCNKDCGRCTRWVHNSDSLKKAAEDLSRIKKRISHDETFKAMLPDTFLWFLNHEGGNLFVSKRAAYYDVMGLAIGSLENSDDLVKNIERQTAETLRDRLHTKLDKVVNSVTEDEYARALKWIMDVTEEASEVEGGVGEPRELSIPFKNFVKQVTGAYRVGKSRGKKATSVEGDVTPVEDGEEDDDGEEWDTDGEDEDLERILPGFMRESKPAIGLVLKPVTKSKMRDVTLHGMAVAEQGSRMKAPTEFLCNEGMHAGRAEAVYTESESGDHIAYCVCQFPEYLVGPTCQQRTYKYVIDYEKWAETGYPEFLVDPVKHFEKAENVCKGLETNSRAVYDSLNNAFVCAPIAELVKTALTFRGPHEPTLIIERDINKAENAPSKSFGVNWSYVNLLERIRRQLQ